MFITKNKTIHSVGNQKFSLQNRILLREFILRPKARALLKFFSSTQILLDAQIYSAKKINFLTVAAIIAVLFATPLAWAQTE